jgi:hypothetical protein
MFWDNFSTNTLLLLQYKLHFVTNRIANRMVDGGVV